MGRVLVFLNDESHEKLKYHARKGKLNLDQAIQQAVNTWLKGR